MRKYIRHDFFQSSASQNLDLNKMLNKKFQRKTVAVDVKNSPIIVIPKLIPHRFKKTPKKSLISLGFVKTHSITVPRVLKNQRMAAVKETLKMLWSV